MKKFFLGLSACFMALTFAACESSTSSDSDSNSSDNKDKTVKGSFGINGESEFSCVVTSGTESDGSQWAQVRLNIPNYKGWLERMTLNADGSASQYYEESYFKLSAYNTVAMCMEFNQAIAEKEKKGRTFEDHQCGNGVSYFVIKATAAQVASDDEDLLASRLNYYKEDCESYQRNWDDGDYDEVSKRN